MTFARRCICILTTTFFVLISVFCWCHGRNSISSTADGRSAIDPLIPLGTRNTETEYLPQKAASISALDDDPPGAASHIILWRHWEQMSSALDSLTQLVWFTASWKARVVEPFIQNSHFRGFDDVENSYPMSTVFNTTKINENLQRRGIPPLTTYTDFLKQRTKNILLIHISYDEPQEFKELSKIKTAAGICRNSECQAMSNDLLETMNRAASKSDDEVSYKVVKCCCIHGLEPTSRGIITDKCGISNPPANHSYVFTDWRGISATKTFRLFSPEYALVEDSIRKNLTYPFSQSVNEGAIKFLRSLSTTNEEQPVLLIHIRSERMIDIGNKYNENYFDDCIKEMLRTKQSKLSSTNKAYVVAYMSDVGKYGSKSCSRKNCYQMMMHVSKKYHFETISYDPRQFGGVDNPMFVAAVEQEMMSMADILILVGGGTFHDHLEQIFLSKHNATSSNLDRLCDLTMKDFV